jgi:Cft2 family RNA processing exonuclease
MLHCFFYGTGRSDEGVSVEVQIAGYRVLLDCGLRDSSALLQSEPPDLVLCSHAHRDHVRSLPAFHRAFPTVPIYSSDVTAALVNLPVSDIASNAVAIESLPWRSALEILPNLTVQLFPSGHLPGGAMILLTDNSGDRTQTLLYTGDLSIANSRLTEGLKLEELRGLAPDVLIIEGTYGTDRYAHRRQLETRLMEKLDRALESGQSVLMPVPPLGLAQELLILLRSHHLFSGRSVKVWVDEPIATVCEQYERMIPSFPSSIQNFARYQALFLDTTIRPWIQRLEHLDQLQTSNDLLPNDLTPNNLTPNNLLLPLVPQILLIQELDSIEDSWPDWTRSLMQRSDWMVLMPQQTDRPAETETFLLPDHCDGATLPQVIHNLRPQHVVFIHGSEEKLLQLAELDDLNSRYKLHIPSPGTALELPIAANFSRPSLPDVSYEGELVETETEVLLSLPSEIMADPRWKKLSDLGVVSAQWQGNTLVIRGISQTPS